MELVVERVPIPVTDMVASVLSRSPTFTGLNEKDINVLRKTAISWKVDKGGFVLREGDEIRYYQVVGEGIVRVFKQSPSGKDFTLGLVVPGGTIGDALLLGGNRASVSAQAVSRTVLVGFGRQQFLSFLRNHPDIVMRIGENISRRLSKRTETIMALASHRAEIRVICVLLDLCLEFGSFLPFGHQQIAEMTGLTRETTSKVLAELAKSSIVRSLTRKLVILDKEGLHLTLLGEKRSARPGYPA